MSCRRKKTGSLGGSNFCLASDFAERRGGVIVARHVRSGVLGWRLRLFFLVSFEGRWSGHLVLELLDFVLDPERGFEFPALAGSTARFLCVFEGALALHVTCQSNKIKAWPNPKPFPSIPPILLKLASPLRCIDHAERLMLTLILSKASSISDKLFSPLWLSSSSVP